MENMGIIKFWLTQRIYKTSRNLFVCRKGFSMRNKSDLDQSEQKALSKPTTYAVGGKRFIVEPVFKDEADETLGEILLKLILDKENYQ